MKLFDHTRQLMLRGGVLVIIAISGLILFSCAKPNTKTDPHAQISETRNTSGQDGSNEGGIPLAVPTPEIVGTDSMDLPFKIDNSNWKLMSDKDGVQTYQRNTQNSDVVAFRGQTLIPASLYKIATILNSEGLRKEWIDALVEAKTIDRVSDTDRIEYNHTKVPWPFQDRDFVYRVSVFPKETPLSLLISIKSIVDPRVPPVDGVVRGDVIRAFYYLREVEGVRATKVVIEMAVDPKGAIPLWMMNMVQKEWPSRTLDRLRKLSQREDIAVSPEIQNFFTKKKKPEKKAEKKVEKKIKTTQTKSH